MASWFDGNVNANDVGGSGGLDWGSMLGGLGSMFGGIQSMGVNSGINSNVQAQQNQAQAATSAQIANLEREIAQSRQQAQDMYQRSLGDVTGQNQGLQGNIDTMTANLAGLSDPNSPYMQQARMAIERKDAAAGRRSQWGEREVQLQAELADRMGRYAPSIQQSITGARDQINRNNQGLASLYSTANNPADRNTLALLSSLQQQQANASAQNTTGRQAANAQANSLQNLLGGAGRLIGGVGGLSGLFGSNSGGGGITGLWGGNTGIGSGGWGGLGASLYGSDSGGWGFGDNGLGVGQGFTGGGLGGGYLDFGSGSTMGLGSGLDFQSGGLGQGLQGYGTSFGGGGISSWDGGYNPPLDFNSGGSVFDDAMWD